jgi:DNA-binding response OmpR family regulator
VAAGFDVCGIARTVDEAVELAENHAPELAVLDIRLAEGGFGPDIAERISRTQRIGILYATGTVDHPRLSNAYGDALISKPYQPRDVVRALNIVGQMVCGDLPSLPFPAGFELLRRRIDDRGGDCASGAPIARGVVG